MILDSWFGAIADAPSLAAKLEARAGITAHGLFLGLAQDLIVAGAGCVRHVRRGEKIPVLLPLFACLICVTPAVAAPPRKRSARERSVAKPSADCLLSASRIPSGNRNETSFSLAPLPSDQRAQFRKWCLHPADECIVSIQGRREFPQASRLATVTALQWHRPQAPRNEAAAAH
jgi:hypothetical protein